MVEFALLLPHQSVVFLLSSIENKVRNDERRGDGQYGTADSPQGVGYSIGNGSSKGFLLHGRKVILCGSTDLKQIYYHEMHFMI